MEIMVFGRRHAVWQDINSSLKALSCWTGLQPAEQQHRRIRVCEGRERCWVPTVPEELQQRQVNGSFPAGTLGQRDAVSRGCKHLPTADGDQLASLVLPSHVIENSSVVDEGVQLPATLSNNTTHHGNGVKKNKKQNLFKRAFLTVLQCTKEDQRSLGRDRFHRTFFTTTVQSRRR